MEFHPWDSETMLRRYIYDYMVRKNLHGSAQLLKEEAGLPDEPLAVDDTSDGFLLEWWSMFTEMYFTERLNQEASHAINQDLLFGLRKQEQRLKAAEPRLSSQQQWTQAQSRQPCFILPKSSSLDGCSSPQNFPIRANRDNILQLYPTQRRFAGPDEQWLKQSQFLRASPYNVQSMGINRMPHLNSANNHHSHVQQMDFKRLRSAGSLHGVPKVILPNTGVHKLTSHQMPLSGWQSTGVGSMFGNTEQQVILIPQNQPQQFQSFNRQQQQNFLQQEHSSILGNYAQSLPAGDFVDMDLQRLIHRADDNCSQKRMLQLQCTGLQPKDQLSGQQFGQIMKKRKQQPLFFEAENNAVVGNITSPSSVTTPTPNCTAYEISMPRALSENGSVLQNIDFYRSDGMGVADTSKPSDEYSINENGGSLEDNLEFLIPDLDDDKMGATPSNALQQSSTDQNKDVSRGFEAQPEI